MREITYAKAITEAIGEEMERDPRVFLMGEDVGAPWEGVLGEFAGIYDKYGPERVRNTPISETAILGSAIGAAATGMRPVAVIMFIDWITVCMDEVVNQLQMRYMNGGQTSLPLTIPVYSGAGLCGAHHHSKNLYGVMMSIPGLKVVVPSSPYDMKGLLKSSIREDNPVIVLEHRMMIASSKKDRIPDEEYTIPLGKADIKRKGKDASVVAIGYMVNRALAAAEKLQEKGISVEVIDPRTIVPLDKQAIVDSVKKTGKLVIMTEEPKTGGAAGEIAAIVAEEAFDHLDAPIKRVCAPDTPVPYSPPLEKAWMPDEEDLIKAINEVL